jgi:hypothetical protein
MGVLGREAVPPPPQTELAFLLLCNVKRSFNIQTSGGIRSGRIRGGLAGLVIYEFIIILDKYDRSFC